MSLSLPNLVGWSTASLRLAKQKIYPSNRRRYPLPELHIQTLPYRAGLKRPFIGEPFMLVRACLFSLSILFCVVPVRSAGQGPVQITIHWNKVIRISRTRPSLLYIATPNSKRGAPLHDPMLRAIRKLGADYVRYSPCNDYPHLTIAELQPPGKRSTSWDFSNGDPMTEDAIDAIGRHPFIMNFSTIPEWMFKTPAPVSYPADPRRAFFQLRARD